MEPTPNLYDNRMIFVLDSHDTVSDSSIHGSAASPLPNEDFTTYATPSSPDTQCTPVSPTPSALCGTSPETDTVHASASTSPAGRRSARFSLAGRDYPVCCLHPGCTARPFRRRADLDRHYKHRHAPDALKESFSCDYIRCTRRLEPFHRLDHFRDHLREYHKEDIEKRGGTHDDRWMVDRHVSTTWWRCPKCLKRVHIERNGYECPNCRTSCQSKRKEARRRERE